MFWGCDKCASAFGPNAFLLWSQSDVHPAKNLMPTHCHITGWACCQTNKCVGNIDDEKSRSRCQHMSTNINTLLKYSSPTSVVAKVLQHPVARKVGRKQCNCNWELAKLQPSSTGVRDKAKNEPPM